MQNQIAKEEGNVSAKCMLLEKASSGSENPNANQSECPLKEKTACKHPIKRKEYRYQIKSADTYAYPNIEQGTYCR